MHLNKSGVRLNLRKRIPDMTMPQEPLGQQQVGHPAGPSDHRIRTVKCNAGDQRHRDLDPQSDTGEDQRDAADHQPAIAVAMSIMRR